MPAYQKTIQELNRWANKTIESVGARTMPMIFTDLNDGLGMCRRDTSTEHWAIGSCQAEDENFAGQEFRKMIIRQSFTVVNPHFAAGPTFHGNKDTSSFLVPSSDEESEEAPTREL